MPETGFLPWKHGCRDAPLLPSEVADFRARRGKAGGLRHIAQRLGEERILEGYHFQDEVKVKPDEEVKTITAPCQDSHPGFCRASALLPGHADAAGTELAKFLHELEPRMLPRDPRHFAKCEAEERPCHVVASC